MKVRAVLGLLVAVAVVSAGSQVRTVRWPDLAPPPPPAVNPFERLPRQDLADLILVAQVHDLRAAKRTPTAKQIKDANDATNRLKRRKIDAVAMLTERDRLIAARTNYEQAIIPALDGQTLKIAGYLLPLEYDNGRVTEFLLVPWVGACIHTPPPARNQIVYVTSAQKIDAQGQFIPVIVEGRMTTKGVMKDLFMVDGNGTVDVGYSMRATAVTRYTP